MKKQLLLPLAAAAGGAAALVLRLLQNRTGFESGTGLPIPGNVPGLALAVLLVVLVLALVALSFLVPKETEEGPFFPRDFRSTQAGLVALPVAGIFLIALAGVLDIAAGAALLGPAGEAAGDVAALTGAGFAVTPRSRVIMGVLALLSAVGLLPHAVSCRLRPGVRPKISVPALLLIPPVCMVIRLVLTYRVDSVDPSLASYYVEVLALTFLTLALYHLSSFAFHAAKTRRFSFYAGFAMVASLASMGDAEGVSALLFYGGAAVTLLGFLLLWLTEGRSVSGIVERSGE